MVEDQVVYTNELVYNLNNYHDIQIPFFSVV